ncbi:MAG: hypothetical protein D3924_10415 [Candidatus Electrothrix sp. AR4]|nr:hypothetical protein [Candidatus Electrothrix sp. AR4]
MISLENLFFFSKIKRLKKNRHRAPGRTSRPQQQYQHGGDTAIPDSTDIKNNIPLQPEPIFDEEFASTIELKSEPRLEQESEEQPEEPSNSVSNQDIDPTADNPEEQVAVDLLAGGIYGVREQKSEPYWLAKIVHIEKQIVHVIRYAAHSHQLMPGLAEETLTIGVDKQDGSFGADHLPIPKSHFAENSVYIRQFPLDLFLNNED